jgi:hypothetical protein
LIPIYSGVDVHRLGFGIAANVLQDVPFHPLVSHQCREDSPESMGREFLLEASLASWSNASPISCLSDFAPDPFFTETVSLVAGEEIFRVACRHELVAFDGMNRFVIYRDDCLLPSFPISKANESVIEHKIFRPNGECFP